MVRVRVRVRVTTYYGHQLVHEGEVVLRGEEYVVVIVGFGFGSGLD